jgi:hypothetical protein
MMLLVDLIGSNDAELTENTVRNPKHYQNTQCKFFHELKKTPVFTSCTTIFITVLAKSVTELPNSLAPREIA